MDLWGALNMTNTFTLHDHLGWSKCLFFKPLSFFFFFKPLCFWSSTFSRQAPDYPYKHLTISQESIYSLTSVPTTQNWWPHVLLEALPSGWLSSIPMSWSHLQIGCSVEVHFLLVKHFECIHPWTRPRFFSFHQLLVVNFLRSHRWNWWRDHDATEIGDIEFVSPICTFWTLWSPIWNEPFTLYHRIVWQIW